MPTKKTEKTRYQPSAEEHAEAAKLVIYAEHNARFASEPLVKSANKRRDDERCAMDYLLLSTNAWQAGEYESALRLAYAGLFLAPEDKRILSCLELRLGTVFADLSGEERTVELAEECFAAARAMDKKFSLPLIFEGDMLFDNEEYDEAEAAYRKAVKLDPTDPSAHNSLGYLYLEIGRLEDAEEEFRMAEKLEPDLPIVHLHLATLLQRQGKLEDAVAELKTAIKMYPENPHYYHTLADLLTEMGRSKDAARYYEKALSLQEKH